MTRTVNGTGQRRTPAFVEETSVVDTGGTCDVRVNMPSVDVKLSTTCEVVAAAAAQSSAGRTRGHIVDFFPPAFLELPLLVAFLSGVSPPWLRS